MGTVEEPAGGDVLGVIRRVVLEEADRLGVRVERIILFGSRARGDHREDSDYDILVVVKGEIGRSLRRELARHIRARILKELSAPADVIVAAEAKWRKYQDELGHLYYEVKREGVPA